MVILSHKTLLIAKVEGQWKKKVEGRLKVRSFAKLSLIRRHFWSKRRFAWVPRTTEINFPEVDHGICICFDSRRNKLSDGRSGSSRMCWGLGYFKAHEDVYFEFSRKRYPRVREKCWVPAFNSQDAVLLTAFERLHTDGLSRDNRFTTRARIVLNCRTFRDVIHSPNSYANCSCSRRWEGFRETESECRCASPCQSPVCIW